jgi:preprotein translocase subunit SecD
MQTSWQLRMLLAFFALGIAMYFLYPSLVYFSLDEKAIKEVRQSKNAFLNYLPSWSAKSHIVPGLDLQGGIHIVLGVDLEKAITDKTARAADRLVEFAKKEGLTITAIKQHGESQSLRDRVDISLANAADVSVFKEKVVKNFADFQFITSGENTVSLRLVPELVQSIRHDAVNQTVTTITNRIDKIGVTEPSIARRGDDQVQIQLPGYDDPEAAKQLLGRTAQLQFQMCADETTFLKDLKDLPPGVELVESGYGRPDSTVGKDTFLKFKETEIDMVRAYLADKVPMDFVVKYGHSGRATLGEKEMRTYTLHRKIQLTGDDLVDARVSPGSDTNPRPGVSLSFGPVGAKIFAELTAVSVGKRMAIVLEDIVDSAPVISTKIPDGNAFISMGGARTSQEMLKDANELSLVLKSGALPAPVTFREERTVGPSLGKDSVEQVKVAYALGALIIALFMMYYYRLAGTFSVIAVIFNVIFILAAMSFLGATITLPGMAALLLTIGVAVDANVIINERIRDELRLGKMPRSAIKAGYDAAMSAIMDANITTFIAGMVLWQFGTGPVQNFATMLMIGTVSSVITSIFVSRIFMDMVTSRGQKTLSI